MENMIELSSIDALAIGIINHMIYILSTVPYYNEKAAINLINNYMINKSI